MAENTKIEWTDATLNPIRARRRYDGRIGFHCEHVSEACRNCYAEAMNKRGLFNGLDYKPGNRDKVKIFLDEATLLKPLKWKKGKRIFWCSMTDVFADFVTDEMRDRVFAIAALTPHHTHILLTKRAAEMRRYCSDPETPHNVASSIMHLCMGGSISGEQALAPLANRARESDREFVNWPLPNVWLGVTAEDQPNADARIPELLATPAAKRLVSIEPMLGPVDLTPEADDTYQMLSEWYGPAGFDPTGSQPRRTRMKGWFPRLDWVICGGESGPGARPMHPDWARGLRDQCKAAGVPFFFKQFGAWKNGSDFKPDAKAVLRDGRIVDPTPDGMSAADREKPVPPEHPTMMRRVGKKLAGRLLDGKEHSEFPR